MSFFPTTMPSRQVIMREAIRVGITWIIFWVLFFSLLCGYKMQTRQYYIAEQEQLLQDVTVQQLAKARNHVPKIRQQQIDEIVTARKVAAQVRKDAAIAKAEAEAQAYVDSFNQHQGQLQNLLDQFQRKEGQINQILEVITTKKIEMDELDQTLRDLPMLTWDNSSNVLSFGKDSKAIENDDSDGSLSSSVQESTYNIQRLLSIADLSEFGTLEEVNDLFTKATEEMDALIAMSLDDNSNNNNNDKHDDAILVLDEVFNVEKYPSPKERLIATNESCPIHEVKEIHINYPRDASKLKDLTQRIQKIEVMLERRATKDVGISHGLSTMVLPDSLMTINKQIKQIQVDIIDDIFTYVESKLFELESKDKKNDNKRKKKSSSSSSSCIVDEEQVMELLDEGLLAMTRKADIRNTLRRKAMEIDPDSSGIILDADLPLVKPQIKSKDYVNLRQIIDTPLLKQSAIWIDNLVETCSGYSDTLDNYLDDNFKDSKESIGVIVVKKVLAESGHVELPHPRTVAKKLPTPLRSLVG